MRIVGGSLKGRVLIAPKNSDIRPTSDRARESVFNILANGKPALDLDGVTVLDVFSGTGALGLEAVSRGAASTLFIDNDTRSLKLVKDNAAALGVIKACQTLKLDAGKLGPPPRLLRKPAGLAFLDPPYAQGLAFPALVSLLRFNWLESGAVVVVETESSAPFEPPPGYDILDTRTYGAALISFLRKKEGS